MSNKTLAAWIKQNGNPYKSPGAPMPKLGQLMTVRNVRCRIVKLHPAGTLDLVSLCGNYAFRVSGLPF